MVNSMENNLGQNPIKWQSKFVDVAALVPFEKNPRKITPADFAHLKASLKEDGYHQRIIATQDLRIIGGHQRIKALKELGFENIEILVPDREITDDQFKRILVRDNLEYGAWELAPLGELLPMAELAEIGLPDAQLRTIGKGIEKGLTNEDEVPEPPAIAKSVAGDIWLLGNHRLMCGSATDADAVKALLAGAQPMLMVTDPPYGVNYDSEWRTRAGVNKVHQKRATGQVMNDDQADWSEAWALFPGDVAYVWHGGLHSAVVAGSLERTGFKMRAQIIWAKASLVMGRGDYHWQHEPCWYAVREKGKGHWAGDRKQATVWPIQNMHATQGNVDDGKTNHSTQKPVECMKRPIENNSKVGDVIYEPFSGSGTTIIAAEKIDRACYAMELNPIYVDMAVARWQAFTGKQARLEATGDTFAERSAA